MQYIAENKMVLSIKAKINKIESNINRKKVGLL